MGVFEGDRPETAPQTFYRKCVVANEIRVSKDVHVINDESQHCNLRISDSEIVALVPAGVKPVVGDGFGFEFGVVIIRSTSLNFYIGADQALAGLPVEISCRQHVDTYNQLPVRERLNRKCL